MERKFGKTLGANTFFETTQLVRRSSHQKPEGSIADVLKLLQGGVAVPIQKLNTAFPGADGLVEKLVSAGYIVVNNGDATLSQSGQHYQKTL